MKDLPKKISDDGIEFELQNIIIKLDDQDLLNSFGDFHKDQIMNAAWAKFNLLYNNDSYNYKIYHGNEIILINKFNKYEVLLYVFMDKNAKLNNKLKRI